LKPGHQEYLFSCRNFKEIVVFNKKILTL